MWCFGASASLHTSAAIIGGNWVVWDLCLPTARINAAPTAVQRVKILTSDDVRRTLFTQVSSGNGSLEKSNSDCAEVEFGEVVTESERSRL